MRLAASVLASQSQAASLVTAPQPVQTQFKHLELIDIRGRQILMVLVLAGGEVRQQMLSLAEPISQEQLSATAERITALCQGLESAAIDLIPTPTEILDQDILTIVRKAMKQDNLLTGEVYRDGLVNVLTEPEFAESESVRQALRVLEERSLLENLLAQTVKNSDVGVVQVLIGGDGTWEELSECSVVLARYGAPDLATGMLGVLGPIRMRYGRTISTVRFVAGLLSQFVVEFHSE
jgi:heat-inducible transcriptional repressor